MASLLQEETDRGAVKAPGLTSWKGPEQPSAPPTSPISETASETVPLDNSATPERVGVQDPSASPTSTPMVAHDASEATVSVAPVSAAPANPVPASALPESRIEDLRIPAEATKPPSAPLRSPLPSQGPSIPGTPATVPSPAALPASASPASGFPTGAQPATPQTASATTVPSWIIPALIAGDLLVVVSGILWASWGRGWGRWPWIAALFAVGCTQAIAALFLSRAGQRSSSGALTGRPGTVPGQAPGIRVRFVEEQPQSRRGDRR